jgi:hypothetical protein
MLLPIPGEPVQRREEGQIVDDPGEFVPVVELPARIQSAKAAGGVGSTRAAAVPSRTRWPCVAEIPI